MQQQTCSCRTFFLDSISLQQLMFKPLNCLSVSRMPFPCLHSFTDALKGQFLDLSMLLLWPEKRISLPMIPICCYLPTSSLGVFAQISGPEILFIEYLVIAIATLPCVLYPLIAIYYVPTYRTWVMKRLCLRRVERPSSIISPQEGTSKVVTRSRPIRIT
ncbi:unnamed protein product [Haemonchus placei]|uniref:G_PROTEIN_RECEP_F1_2 domain-containing protein n=1 Tax=Haemonchus placei TaxID=6290 RepID=A0A0N4XBV1_HAEPC|nr:unnamed protein product [Haemonchus placei]